MINSNQSIISLIHFFCGKEVLERRIDGHFDSLFPFRDSSRKSNKFDRFFSSVPILENEFFFPHRFDQVLRLRKSNKNFLFEPFDSYDWASDHKLTFLYPPYLKLKKIEENQFSINFPITNSIACALHLEILESNVDNCLYETGSK